MAFLDTIRSLLGLGRPCPRCGEGLARHGLFTVPVDDRLFLVTRLLMLGGLKDEAIRLEAEALLSARMGLPKDVSSGVRVAFEHCRTCRHGELQAELLQQGTVRETRRHLAVGPGYTELAKLLGGA